MTTVCPLVTAETVLLGFCYWLSLVQASVADQSSLEVHPLLLEVLGLHFSSHLLALGDAPPPSRGGVGHGLIRSWKPHQLFKRDTLI